MDSSLAVASSAPLSPAMLAVARVRDSGSRIQAWHHAAAEDTGLADGSFDLVTLPFVCHELPQAATRAVLAEVARLLRPGGCRRRSPPCSRAQSPTWRSISASTCRQPWSRQASNRYGARPVIPATGCWWRAAEPRELVDPLHGGVPGRLRFSRLREIPAALQAATHPMADTFSFDVGCIAQS